MCLPAMCSRCVFGKRWLRRYDYITREFQERVECNRKDNRFFQFGEFYSKSYSKKTHSTIPDGSSNLATIRLGQPLSSITQPDVPSPPKGLYIIVFFSSSFTCERRVSI